MNPEIRRTLKEMNTEDWKEIPVEYGAGNPVHPCPP